MSSLFYFRLKRLTEFIINQNVNIIRSLSTEAFSSSLESRLKHYEPIETNVFENIPRSKTQHNLPVYSIAAFVNKSSTLQELIKLGVNLHKIEKIKGAQEVILRLDFDKDIKPYVQFFRDIGLSVDVYGEFITKNPLIFKEDLENLQIRINYLDSKNFSQDDICRILTKNPLWLSCKTQNIDNRLGYFQGKFLLTGPEVRILTVRMPKIIISDLNHIEETYFSVKEELGFKKEEIKTLVLKKPKIFTLNRQHLIDRFCYLHSVLGLDHKDLLNQPGILLSRQSKVRERHEFLKELHRAQYNAQKPGYISPLSLVSGSDFEFCSKICNVSVNTYNKFLKTLC